VALLFAVGIGEPSPSGKLDVNGRIAAKGYKNTIYNIVLMESVGERLVL
jgi:hypothetical protein